jgi:SAM-dependent methyltransferase
MNRLHRWYCRSSHWKKTLENEVLPEVLSGVNLGDEVLELGPGPGLATDWLQQLCNQLTCIEVDSKLAGALRARRTNTNVTVDCGDATAMPYIDRSFSSVVSLTMLHHIPSRPAVRGGSSSSETGRGVRGSRQHGIAIDEHVSLSRHYDFGGSRNLSWQTCCRRFHERKDSSRSSKIFLPCPPTHRHHG